MNQYQALTLDTVKNITFLLEGVYKLRLQDKLGRWSKNVHFFVNIYTIENVNAGG